MLTALIFLSGCSSSTLIQTTPPGAAVYVDMQRVGTTPYTYTDTKIVGATTILTLKKDGYQDMNVTLTRNEKADVGAIIGGVFLLVPFLWVCEYNPMHNYELTPANVGNSTQPADHNANFQVPVNPSNTVTSVPNNQPPANQGDNSTNELSKLKNLYDSKVITDLEYNTLKGEILNNKYDYTNSSADQISKLKSWLDQKLITQDDFNKRKKSIIYTGSK